MTHFFDFDLCRYQSGPYDALEWKCPLFAIGWLEQGKDYSSGEVPEVFTDRISQLASQFGAAFPRQHFRGLHQCSICAVNDRAAECLQNSHINLFIPGQDCVYLAPGRIDHYIDQHSYRPPDEFIDAVMRCPKPGSRSFLMAIQKLNGGVEGPLFS